MKESLLGKWQFYINDEAKKHNNFLESLVKKISDSIYRYYDAVGELPFIFKERVTSTYVTIALSKMSPAVANELYFKIDRNKKTRYLDVWFYDSSNQRQYFIELKQVNKSLEAKNFTKSFKNDIEECFKQTKDLTEDSISRNFSPVSDDDRFYRMSMIVAFSWKGFSNKENFENFEIKDADTLFQEVNEELKSELNYFAICKIAKAISEKPLKVNDEKYQIFPHIFLFGKIEEIKMRQ